MQANDTATDGTIGVQVQNLITALNGATSDLLAIPVSSGSTDDLPRDIDLSRVLGETIQCANVETEPKNLHHDV